MVGRRNLERRIIDSALAIAAERGWAGVRLRQVAETMAVYLPGLLISSWLTVFVINGAVAQGLLTRIGQATRPTPAYAAVEPPNWHSTAVEPYSARFVK